MLIKKKELQNSNTLIIVKYLTDLSGMGVTIKDKGVRLAKNMIKEVFESAKYIINNFDQNNREATRISSLLKHSLKHLYKITKDEYELKSCNKEIKRFIDKRLYLSK